MSFYEKYIKYKKKYLELKMLFQNNQLGGANKYFPKHNDEIKIDEVGKYSISKPYITKQIIDIIKKFMNTREIIITDAMACVGGDTLSFANNFKKVNAIELDSKRFEFLKHNMKLFNKKNINFYNSDFLEVIKKLNQDVIYLDPPWGGPDYKNQQSVSFSVSNKKLSEIIDEIIKEQLCKLIVLKLPFNYDLNEFNKYEINKFILNRILLIIIKV